MGWYRGGRGSETILYPSQRRMTCREVLTESLLMVPAKPTILQVLKNAVKMKMGIAILMPAEIIGDWFWFPRSLDIASCLRIVTWFVIAWAATIWATTKAPTADNHASAGPRTFGFVAAIHIVYWSWNGDVWHTKLGLELVPTVRAEIISTDPPSI